MLSCRLGLTMKFILCCISFVPLSCSLYGHCVLNFYCSLFCAFYYIKPHSPAISLRLHIFSIISKINYDFLTMVVSIHILFSSSKCFSPILIFNGNFSIHRCNQIISNETSFPIKMSKEHQKNSLNFPLWRQLSLSFCSLHSITL